MGPQKQKWNFSPSLHLPLPSWPKIMMILVIRKRVKRKLSTRDHGNVRVSKLSILQPPSTNASPERPIKRIVICQNAARFNVESQRTLAGPRRSTAIPILVGFFAKRTLQPPLVHATKR